MTGAAISIEHVTKRFPLKGQSEGVLALQDISISVGQSEFVALLGPERLREKHAASSCRLA